MSIDIQQIAKKLDFELEDMVALFGIFVQSANESLLKLFEAIEKNDLNNIYIAAHTIKGSAANLLLSDISDTASYIENSAKNRESIAYEEHALKIKNMVEKIEKEL